ncbi:T9SS type A sorting domain-containing protein [Aquimarina agarilytica]|uniref:T9SS type A sorting domain-containing protein n=1 Tax=Aquimarina agarilytica TaxID=1087449 RepID=UPI0002892DBA|nr:T9SS type A sorting domain-containing protein [Aquimarina agarilytica]
MKKLLKKFLIITCLISFNALVAQESTTWVSRPADNATFEAGTSITGLSVDYVIDSGREIGPFNAAFRIRITPTNEQVGVFIHTANGATGSGTGSGDLAINGELLPSDMLPDGQSYILIATMSTRMIGVTDNSTNAFPDSVTIPITITNSTLSTSEFSGNINGSFGPNPASDMITIDSNIQTETYSVADLSGATVKTVKAEGTLDVSDLPSGIYFLITDVGVAKFEKN